MNPAPERKRTRKKTKTRNNRDGSSKAGNRHRNVTPLAVLSTKSITATQISI